MNPSDFLRGLCDVPERFSAFTVRVGFSHPGNESDETEFCIERQNVEELDELFGTFCNENGFENVEVLYVDVVLMALTMDELVRTEEQM